MKRFAGAVLLALLIVLAWGKAQAGVLSEMLWMCHVATGAVALGLLLNWRACVALGFLFHIAVGVPAYILHLAHGGDTTWVSFSLHVLSPLGGWLAWRAKTLPPLTPTLTLGCYAVAATLCVFFTPEALNINQIFRPWEPLAVVGVWPGRIGNALLMLVLLMAGQWLFNRGKAHPRG